MLSAATENVRWIADWSRQDHGAIARSADPRKIRSVGIIGAGMMGAEIAAAHVLHRLPVVIYDVDQGTLSGAVASIAAELCAADGHLAPETLRRLVHPTADLAEAAHCDLVLETITESLPAKLQAFSQIRGHLTEHAIVASNTSTIPIQRLASGLGDASRFCGMHFCHPVRQRPLVEIVCGLKTSDHTVAAAVAHARRIDRMPIVVQDGPGFVVNRLLFPYLGAALELLREGVSIESIERAAIEFGMALGPLRMMDEMGLDTTVRAACVLAGAFPERVVSSPRLVSMVKAGRLGRKTGVGFFSYAGPEGNATQNIAETSETLAPRKCPTPSDRQDDIAYRLVLPMLLEATRILEEGKVRDVRDIDLAVLFGLGFPAEKGGLLWWADALGAGRILALLRSLDKMGARAEPTAMLQDLARTGGTFYPLTDAVRAQPA